MLGDPGSDGGPLPITRERMVEVVTEWPVSMHTPETTREQLRVSRELFVHALLVYEFATVGVAWSCSRWSPAYAGRSAQTSLQRSSNWSSAEANGDSFPRALLRHSTRVGNCATSSGIPRTRLCGLSAWLATR